MEPINYLKTRKRFSEKLNDSGYTLIEVLLAVAILTIGMLGTSALALGVINGNSVSKDVTTGSTLAQDKIESIREAGYLGLPSSDTTEIEDYGDIQYTIDSETADYSAYKRVTTTQIDSPMVGMKTVTVSVYWDSNAIPLTFTTYIAR